MRSDLTDAVLAADGGGTTCRLALELGGRRHQVTLGATNATTDLGGTVATLNDGLCALADAAGLAPEALWPLPAYLGIAGVLGAAEAGALRAGLPLRHAVIEDDRPAAVAGALGATDGAVAALGTGSFFALRQDGATRFAGGWGSRLGDGASGFWIGREALAAALDAHDRVIVGTGLTEALLARWQGRPRDLVGFAGTATPGQIAAFAPNVIAAAEAGDRVARGILARGATHIAGVLTAIGWRTGLPICLLGGVAAAYRGHLPDALTADLAAPRGTALDGALGLARQVAAKGAW